MKVTRAGDYWSAPREEPRRTPVSNADLANLIKGPSIPTGSLRWADKGAAEVDDPSLPRPFQRATSEVEMLERNFGSDGGNSATDGTPERWPGVLPGEKILNATGDIGESAIDRLKKIPTPKPKPDPKTTPAPKTARRRRYAMPAPNPQDLQPTYEDTGSTHGAGMFQDGGGQKWLVKHPPGGEGWPAPLDTGTAALQQRSGLTTPEIYQIDMDGVPTSVHKMMPGAKNAFPGKRFDHASLSDQDIMTLQKHNVLDWLTSNHDAHPGQFIRTPEGELVGIDKGQSYRYFGSDKLSPKFHPNADYGETEPMYNTMWRNFSQGKGHMNDPRSGELGDYINGLQSMPDEEFHSYLRPYAEQAALVGKLGTGGGLGQPGHIQANDVESFLAAASERKNNLGRDFGSLYEKALSRQQGAGARVGRMYA